MQAVIDYLNPDLPANLARVKMRVIDATAATLEGYGYLVDDPAKCKIEIVRWPAQGTRPVDLDTGDQGGTTDGHVRQRVEGRHPLWPQRSRRRPLHPRVRRGARAAPMPTTRAPRSASCSGMRTTIRTAASSFSRSTGSRFSFRSRCPGDDVAPGKFVCFRFDGSQGLYIHPNIWHEGVFATSGSQRFFDQQGAVHARVSVDFAREFGCLLEAPIE